MACLHCIGASGGECIGTPAFRASIRLCARGINSPRSAYDGLKRPEPAQPAALVRPLLQGYTRGDPLPLPPVGFPRDGDFQKGRVVSDDGRIPTNGLKFRPPIEELEETLKEKIRRSRDAGDRETADLYQEVLDLAREKSKALREGSEESAASGTADPSTS